MTTSPITSPPKEAIEPITLSMFEQLAARLPEQIDFVELGIAATLIAVTIIIGQIAAHVTSRKIAPYMDGEGGDDIPLKFQPLVKAGVPVLRYGISALLFWIARNSWQWTFLPEIVLSFALALAAGMAVHRLLRSLSLSFWMAIAASSAIFAFIFSGSVGGMTSVSSMLDGIAFQIGRNRLSLLMLVTALLVAIFLIALVRLGNRAAKLLLGRNKSLDDGQRLLGEKLAMVALVVAAFFIGIDMLGIDLTALAVFSGAIGLAIGFGLQKQLAI